MAPPAPLTPLDKDFSSCFSWFLFDEVHGKRDEIRRCVVLTFDRISYYSAGWFAYWYEYISDWTSFCVPLTDPKGNLKLPVIT